VGVIQRIVDARWLEPQGGFAQGVILIQDGRLRLRPGVQDRAGSGDIGAQGMLVLPGLVDPHVHLREPGQARKEGLKNGGLAALAGGVTTLLDMPNNNPPTSTAARLEAKRGLFRRKSPVNWGLFLQATPRHQDPNVAASIAPGTSALKIYMARSSAHPAVNDPRVLRGLLRAWPRVAIHAEDDSAFKAGPFDQRQVRHHVHRPRASIQLALHKIEAALRALPPNERPRVVILHAATIQEVRWLARMKAEGFDLWGETCPHYLVFTEQDQERLGGLLKVNPPIRGPQDREALRRALADGTIDFLATDHAPHAPTEKAQLADPPSGIAAIEWLWPLLLGFQEQGWLGWEQLTRVGCAAASRCYHLPGRGGIRDGAAADLVLVRRVEKPLPTRIHTRAAARPYPALSWRVQSTIVNGLLAYHDGHATGARGAQEIYAP